MKTTIPLDRDVFKHSMRVKLADIDELNHVNNVVYLQWVQEVASLHWKNRASDDQLKQWQWVVLRHEIDYHAPALMDDVINAYTWIDLPDGARQNRWVYFIRDSDQKSIATARTTWCLLDAASGRPKRVGDDINRCFGL
ncbi:MAG TPA: thioesterase family protein [Cyclobacteriaceae bacterium]|nr:thioesterase family protein [Cyclobacteriaceae bacterium]